MQRVFFCYVGANDPRKADPNLFVPFIDNQFLPEAVRRFFRFGVPRLSEEHKMSRCKNGEVDQKHFGKNENCENDSFQKRPFLSKNESVF